MILSVNVFLESLNVKLTAKDFFLSPMFFSLYSSKRLTFFKILFSNLNAKFLIVSKVISSSKIIERSLLEDGNLDNSLCLIFIDLNFMLSRSKLSMCIFCSNENS